MDRQAYPGRPRSPAVDLLHTTADWSAEAIGKFTADAGVAGICLHVLHDQRDGQLTRHICAEVPDWKKVPSAGKAAQR